MGRPDGKINALFALSFGQMCAQLFVNVIMGSLTEEILIQLADLKNFLFFWQLSAWLQAFSLLLFLPLQGLFLPSFLLLPLLFFVFFSLFLP